jgi:hypothetical protein
MSEPSDRPIRSRPRAQREQEHNRSDCRVDDEANDPEAKTNTDAMQKPVADERTDDANCCIAGETEPFAPNNLAHHPATSPTTKITINSWLDRCMLFQPFTLVRDRN